MPDFGVKLNGVGLGAYTYDSGFFQVKGGELEIDDGTRLEALVKMDLSLGHVADDDFPVGE